MSQNYSPILEIIQMYNSNTHGKVKEGSEKVVNFDVGSCYMGIHICKNWSVVNFWFVFNTLCKLYLKKIKNQVKLICVNTERISEFCNFCLAIIHDKVFLPPSFCYNPGQMYMDNQSSVRGDMKFPLEKLCWLSDRFYSSFSNRLVLTIHFFI